MKKKNLLCLMFAVLMMFLMSVPVWAVDEDVAATEEAICGNNTEVTIMWDPLCALFGHDFSVWNFLSYHTIHQYQGTSDCVKYWYNNYSCSRSLCPNSQDRPAGLDYISCNIH